VDSPFRPQPGHPDVLRHDTLHCRACTATMNAAVSISDPGPAPAPSDGDFAICCRCGEVSIYTIGPLGAALREPTGRELARFAANPANTSIIRDLHRFWAEHPDR
jgi:hypothetical protein